MTAHRLTAALAALVAGVALGAPPAAAGTLAAPAARAYRTERIGTLPGSISSFPTAINGSGDVVGVSDYPNLDQRAFRWHAGHMTDLGTLGGSTAYAEDINAHGDVVGYSTTADGATHAFLWSAGRMRDLGTFGFEGSDASAISDNGTIVGAVFTSTARKAFRWQAGRLTVFADHTWATDVNNAGTIVGTGPGTGPGNDFRRLLRWDGTTPTVFGDLAGFTSSFGLPGINRRGDVVTSAYNSHEPSPFVWLDGTLREPAVLEHTTGGCTATGINDRRQIIGNCNNHFVLVPYLADGDLTVVDLSTRGIPGGTFLQAINNRGQIAGTLQLRDSGSQAAVFTPA